MRFVSHLFIELGPTYNSKRIRIDVVGDDQFRHSLKCRTNCFNSRNLRRANERHKIRVPSLFTPRPAAIVYFITNVIHTNRKIGRFSVNKQSTRVFFSTALCDGGRPLSKSRECFSSNESDNQPWKLLWIPMDQYILWAHQNNLISRIYQFRFGKGAIKKTHSSHSLPIYCCSDVHMAKEMLFVCGNFPIFVVRQNPEWRATDVNNSVCFGTICSK